MNQDKFIQTALEEYRKKNGIEMRLLIDLMIANQGDGASTRATLDELERFLTKKLKEAYKEGKKLC